MTSGLARRASRGDELQRGGRVRGDRSSASTATQPPRDSADEVGPFNATAVEVAEDVLDVGR